MEAISKLPPKIRVLFVAANPRDESPLLLDEEIRDITTKIRASEYRDSVELISAWAARPADLLQALNQYRPHVVHFSGHGSPEGEIIFLDINGEAKPVSQAAIVEVMKATGDELRLVVFNSCFSSSQAEAVTRHIDVAIGMNAPIGDEAARVFAAQFYSAIGFGRSIGQAFAQARVALMLEGISDENVPTLFTREEINANQVILVRPQSIEGDTRQAEESVSDVAVRLVERFDYEAVRESWLSSEHAKHDAEREVENLFQELEALAHQVGKSGLHLEFRRGDQHSLTLAHPHGSLTVGWWCTYVNTISSSGLVVRIWDRKLEPYAMVWGGRHKPQELQNINYAADLGPGRHVGWSEESGKRRFLTSSQLADQCLRTLLNQIDKRERVSSAQPFDEESDW
jgi:hypothetical protein